MLTELFLRQVLRLRSTAKIDHESAISLQRGQFDPKFQVEGVAPTSHLSLTVFTQRNFVADFLQAKCDFTRETAVLRFGTLLWGLGATNDERLRLIGKRVVDFLLVLK